MQVEKKSVTARSAKDYLSKNEIPQLFECLMTGLMYHRPLDHILYLQECLERIKKHGVNGLRWDMFLEAKKIPLPPIDSAPRENYRPQPLPEIGSLQLRIPMHASIIIVQAGPGVDKGTICKKICSNFSSYVHIQVGLILRDRALVEAQNNKSPWRNVKDLIDCGELVPEEFVLETLIKELNKYDKHDNFLIEGYPRTAKEREDFERFIGLNRVKFMVLIDCEEDVCQKYLLERAPTNGWCDHSNTAINKRILSYKTNTLAVCKYFDDQKKLRLVDGDQNRDIVMKDVHKIFANELNEPIIPHPPLSPKEQQSPEPEAPVDVSPGREPLTEILQLSGIEPEGDRNIDLIQCRFVLVLGGPGSGKSEVIERVCSQHSLWTYIDVNEMIRRGVIDSGTRNDELATSNENRPFVENWNINVTALNDSIKSVPPEMDVVIIEGFPQTGAQLNYFNTKIGRADIVVLLDSEEDVMRARLAERYCRAQRVEDNDTYSDLRIHHFKNNGLSICRYYDERRQLFIVAGDRDLLDVALDFEKIVDQQVTIVNDDPSDILLDNGTVDDEKSKAAAITIQASLRGHLARKRMKENSTNNANNNSLTNEDQENKILVLEDDQKVKEKASEGNESTENIENEYGETDEKDEVVGEEMIDEKHNGNDDNEPPEMEDNIDNNSVDEPIKLMINPMLGQNSVRTTSQLELRDAHVVFILGGPGSGKKTLGSHIVSRFAVPFIHVDQIISDAIEMEAEDFEELKKYVDNKDCDETPIYSLIRKSFMASLTETKVIFVAGFPRTVQQYRRFNTDVSRVSAAIFLDVEEDTLKSRLAAIADPELPFNYVGQLDAFRANNPGLLSELNESDLFTTVDATEGVLEVLQHVTEIIENFQFMKTEE